MPITREINENLQRSVIFVEGQFDFSSVQDFRRCYEDLTDHEITIDFRDADYMDSAGLGMLLNMQTSLKKPDKSIHIVNCMPQIKKVLLISRFDKKFVIE